MKKQRQTCAAVLPVVADPEDVGVRAVWVLIESGLQLPEPAADASLHGRPSVLTALSVKGMHTISWTRSRGGTPGAGMCPGRHLVISADDSLVSEHQHLVPASTSQPSLWGNAMCRALMPRAILGREVADETNLLTLRLMRSMTLGSIGCVSEKLRTSAPNGDPDSGSAAYAWSAAWPGALLPWMRPADALASAAADVMELTPEV